MRLLDIRVKTLYEVIKCLPADCINKKMKEIDLTSSAVFKILKLMELSGLVVREKTGRSVKITLTPNGELLKNTMNQLNYEVEV